MEIKDYLVLRNMISKQIVGYQLHQSRKLDGVMHQLLLEILSIVLVENQVIRYVNQLLRDTILN